MKIVNVVIPFVPYFLASVFTVAFAQEDLIETGAYVREAIAKGQISEALARLEAKARAAESAQQWRQASVTYGEASRVARIGGQIQRALSLGNKALEVADAANDPDLQVQAALRVSQVLVRGVGKHLEGRKTLLNAIDFLALISNETIRDARGASLHTELGHSYLKSGEVSEAIKAFELAVQLRESLIAHYQQRKDGRALRRNQDTLVYHLRGLGDAYQAARMTDRALQTLEKAIRVSRESQLESFRTSFIYQSLGEIHTMRKDFTRAEEYFRHAFDLGKKLGLAVLIRQSGTALGNLLLDSGRTANAINFLQSAIDSTESSRSGLESEELRSSFFENQIGPYPGIIRAYSKNQNIVAAFNFNERARSRAFLDMVGSRVQAIEAEQGYDEKLSEKQKKDKERVSLLSVDPLTLAQVQALLEPSQVLLEYFVTAEKIFLWIVDKQQIRALPVRISQAELIRRVEALRGAISDLKPLKEYQALARDLYAQLVATAEPFIQGKELIIVPHDLLHNLPFQALVGKDGRYLIERAPIHYLSSASLMQFTRAKRRAIGNKVLAIGNPSLGESVKELKFAEQETAVVQRLFPATTLLQRNEATKLKAKGLASQHDILHFAAHTDLNQDDPLSSAVLLARSAMDDGRLEVKDILDLDLKASLVVLSGCETALGKLSRGDELVGLTRAFIYAGTPSVIASLWKVDDASTAFLMSSFYKNLKTKSKVESLRQAQLDMIRGKVNTNLIAQRGVGGVGKLGQTPVRNSQGSISTSHPYFWAPFILVGDGK